MPYVTELIGFIAFAVVMMVFLVQEFSQGFELPEEAKEVDDRWALAYLEAVPVVLVSLALLLSFWGWGTMSSSSVQLFVGLAVLVGGMVVRRWSFVALGKFHQAVVTIHDNHELITDGPYRWVRHPIYSGSAVAFLGIGLALGTWPGLALVFVGTLPGMARRIQVEERSMRQALGERYDQYAEGRARLLPLVW